MPLAGLVEPAGDVRPAHCEHVTNITSWRQRQRSAHRFRFNPFRRKTAHCNAGDEPIWLPSDDHRANTDAVMAAVRNLMIFESERPRRLSRYCSASSWARCQPRKASMNGSRSPSSTVSTWPTS